MSTVKSNKFSPQSLPIVQIDGFNEVESFIVGVSQTSFDSTKFTSSTPIRAFKRNDGDPSIWDELTVTWTDGDTFEITESYSEGDEILLYGIGSYYKGPNGIGSIDLLTVDLSQSENLESGFYTLIDTGYSGSLVQFKDNGNVKQIYIPFGKEQIQTRDNSSGSFPDFKPASAVDVEEKTASFTLADDDSFKHLRVENSSAVNVTVPDSATFNFPFGTYFDITQTGAGQVSIVTGTGVVVNSPDSFLSTRVQYSKIKLVKVGTDEWDLSGDLA